MLVDQADHFEEEVGGDLEGFGADLVHGVLGGVVVTVRGGRGVGAVVDVDEVEDGDAALLEGDVIVADGVGVFVDVGGVASVLGGDLEQVAEPGGGVLLVVDVEVLVADHVGEEECLDFFEGAVAAPLGGEVAGAVEGVGGGPGLDGLFAVVEDEPDGVSLGRMGAEVGADPDEQGSGAGSVVGADEGDVFEGPVGLVMAGQNDYRIFFAGEADEVETSELTAVVRVGVVSGAFLAGKSAGADAVSFVSPVRAGLSTEAFVVAADTEGGSISPTRRMLIKQQSQRDSNDL